MTKTGLMPETTDVLELAKALIEGYKKAKSDGTINIMDVQHLVAPALKIPAAFEGLQNVPTEWANMGEAQIEQVLGYVKEQVNDPEIVRLVYHLIGAGAAVNAILKKDDVVS